MNLTHISKIISHALRHEPWVYELELDNDGWVDIDNLIKALNNTGNDEINLSVIYSIIKNSDKPRFEIKGNKIRASYGHSIDHKISHTLTMPPEVLYHGTTDSVAYASIQPQVGTQLTWLQAARNAQAAADATFAPGSIGAAKVWTIKARLKAARLPTEGKIRYVPPPGYKPSNHLPKNHQTQGIRDKFGNVWVRGESRTPGELFEWDVQLSDLGRKKLGWASRDVKHINVSLKGRITHE
jgi:hypothetical protein